ncbi:uncharacterized protein CLUP02_16399 [Colletotrichum lupini]|uniref:Uncharacterized protein n=1 Tax=Colletotrichum lupini TaxID=145971 RepID=A0A9Q8T822_9PEZI|nr:uncharacterized protein CLUP02_16399 [Colletotrichum lupini]UQC90867.1 hypothetical protein CLUP02_16399 [Colletotrichum lupini]
MCVLICTYVTDIPARLGTAEGPYPPPPPVKTRPRGIDTSGSLHAHPESTGSLSDPRPVKPDPPFEAESPVHRNPRTPERRPSQPAKPASLSGAKRRFDGSTRPNSLLHWEHDTSESYESEQHGETKHHIDEPRPSIDNYIILQNSHIEGHANGAAMLDSWRG